MCQIRSRYSAGAKRSMPSGCSRTCPSASTTRVGAAMRVTSCGPGIIREPVAAREGWGQLLEHQYGGEGQPAALAQWWSEAARLRSGGFDRILEPAPYCPTRADLISRKVRGRAFMQEIATVFPGTADDYLEGVQAH